MKQKPKELDWKEKFKNEFYEGDDYTSNKYENLVSFIEYEILPQQRTELLEEIKEKVEDRIKHVNIFSTETGNKFKDDVIEIINLLNKKDE